MLNGYSEIEKIALQRKAEENGMRLVTLYNGDGRIASFKLYRVLSNHRDMYLGQRVTLKDMRKLVDLCSHNRR